MVQRLLPIVLAQLAGSADAQFDKGTWLFEVVGGPVSPSNPSVTVNLYAGFPIVAPFTAFGDAGLSITSSDPTGQFTDLAPGAGMLLSFHILGTPNATGGVSGLHFAQVNFANVSLTTNPIHLWQATWTTTDFTPRTVDLASSATTSFKVHDDHNKVIAEVQLYPDKFEHGSGVIQVVPSPSGAILLAASSVLAMRRRR